MTRYSASRGIMYTVPPTNNDEAETATVEAETGEPAAADD